MDPVRVFVAASPSEWLPMKVLEFSLQETTDLPVQAIAIASFNRSIPLPKASANQPRTPFSFQRFLIPELCDYCGRAIYLDADMQVFADIAALWNAPMGDHDLLAVSEGTAGRRGQFSVILLDCARLRWNINDIVEALDAGSFTYEDLMFEMCVATSVGRTIDPAWNSLEKHDPGKTRLLHYTDMNTQPWVSGENPLGHLWVACLGRALSAGFISWADLDREIARGHVRPSLKPAAQGVVLSTDARLTLDHGFEAPYKAITKRGSAGPADPSSWIERLRRGWRATRAGVSRR